MSTRAAPRLPQSPAGEAFEMRLQLGDYERHLHAANVRIRQLEAEAAAAAPHPTIRVDRRALREENERLQRSVAEAAAARESARLERTERVNALCALACKWVYALLATGIYVFIGVFAYDKLEGWEVVPTVYFCFVTMSTVGYGDITPVTDAAKGFTLVMIIFGIALISALWGGAVCAVTQPITRKGRALLRSLFPLEKHDVDGDGSADFSYPRHVAAYYAINMTPSLLLNVSVQLSCAAAFQVLEGWSFFDAFYHCIVTATTVGYGDISIATQAGMMFSCMHIVISVAMIAELINTGTTLQVLGPAYIALALALNLVTPALPRPLPGPGDDRQAYQQLNSTMAPPMPSARFGSIELS